MEQAFSTDTLHIKQQGGLFKIKAKKRFSLVIAIYFWFKGMCAIKMTPAASVEWGKEAGLGVESSARKPVNKKPEEFCFGDLQTSYEVLC